ncbi:PREDICTED: uncharacterized protein LOC106811492, partial [Priapulus caudatus]|uniref:Uncharacterized protein LOC106811492 n=1 Tax=Priapulus caudatus TaxID=37621 RepID=A0ABM1EEJ7_PRICU
YLDGNVDLKSNRNVAEKRLYGIERRLEKDPELAATYQDQISELLETGRAELVGKEDTKNPVWYLPHHPVVKADRVTTKCRIVFDGSAKGPKYQNEEMFWINRVQRKAFPEEMRLLEAGKPVSKTSRLLPLSPVWDEKRVTEAPPFLYVGTDFAGPLYVKTSRGDDTKKVYIVIFTCMTTRAVHLELVENMSAGEFLQAFERMTNRRGKYGVLYSDNAKSFKRAANVLELLYKAKKDKQKIQDCLRHNGTEWKFITEKAPWQGGFYERLIRSIKIPLRKFLGKAQLTFIELVTVLTDVEAQLNSRPLTMVSADKEDPLPFTPGHLLIGRNLQVMPDLDARTRDSSIGKKMAISSAYQQVILEQMAK